jgi:hypothetical protein
MKINVLYGNEKVFDVRTRGRVLSIEDAVKEYLGLYDISAKSEADQAMLEDAWIRNDFIILCENGRYRVDVENLKFAMPPVKQIPEEDEPEEVEPEVTTTITVDVTDKEAGELQIRCYSSEKGWQEIRIPEVEEQVHRVMGVLKKIIDVIHKKG